MTLGKKNRLDEVSSGMTLLRAPRQNITFKPLNLKPLGSPLSLDFDDWDDEEFEGESPGAEERGCSKRS